MMKFRMDTHMVNMGTLTKLKARSGSAIRLAHYNPSDKLGLDKEGAKDLLEKNLKKLREYQYKLYAQQKRALLVVLQGTDTSGKDGVLRHVFSTFNPQGCRVESFKKPSDEELSHDFLWRVHQKVPPKGQIGVFNRSHYEDVLVVFVHDLISKKDRPVRYRQINDFERYLSENGVHILKFFLHISKEEQAARLKDRLESKDERWKYNENDEKERKLWPDYVKAYEKAISACSTPWAPWHIIPSDYKWVRNTVVSQVLLDAFEKINPQFPSK